MDNDNKIGIVNQESEQRHKEVLLFLNDELNRLQKDSDSTSYDLNEEYAKTKKNKTPFSFLVIFFSAVVVGLASWGITAYIGKQNEEITVSMEEFEGLNIKNLLDSVSKVQANYDSAMKNKTNLIADRDLAIKKANDKKESDLFLIDSLNLDAKEAEIRKQAVEEEFQDAVALVNEVYDPQLALAETELTEYKKQLDEYDTSKVEAAREQEQVLDSERRVHELELQKVSDDYEKRIAGIENERIKERESYTEQMRKSVTEVSQKYQKEIDLLDPVLNKTSSNQLVTLLNQKEVNQFNAGEFITENEIDDTTVATALTEFQSSYNDYKTILEPIEQIPYKNSVPSYISASKKILDTMGNSFENIIIKFFAEKKELNNTISDLNEQILNLKNTYANEKAKMQADFIQQKETLANDYVGLYDGILASAKANAVVVSAHSKDNIRIYVIPQNRENIGEEGISAEIKAAKSIKGTVKPIPNETGFYLFEAGLDKSGNPIEFDLESVVPGLFVKLSSR